MNKIALFFKQTYIEMKHVVWPTRARALMYTIIVVLFSVAIGYLLGGFDSLFRAVLRGVFY